MKNPPQPPWGFHLKSEDKTELQPSGCPQFGHLGPCVLRLEGEHSNVLVPTGHTEPWVTETIRVLMIQETEDGAGEEYPVAFLFHTAFPSDPCKWTAVQTASLGRYPAMATCGTSSNPIDFFKALEMGPLSQEFRLCPSLQVCSSSHTLSEVVAA